MSVAVVGDILLVTFNGLASAQLVQLTHTYRIFQATGGPDILDVQDAILATIKAGGADDIETPYTNCLATNYTGSEIWCQRIRATRMRKSVVAMTTNGQSGASEYTNTASTITFRTDLSGRRFQGTKHIGPITDGAGYVVAGAIGANQLVLNDLLAVAMKATISVMGGNVVVVPVVYHKALPVDYFTDITAHANGLTARTMRRRTVGLGK